MIFLNKNGARIVVLSKIIDLERLLIEIGALKESDVRLKKRDGEDEDKKADDLNIEDYDDDWD